MNATQDTQALGAVEELSPEQLQAVSGGIAPLVAVAIVALAGLDCFIWYHAGKQAGRNGD